MLTSACRRECAFSHRAGAVGTAAAVSDAAALAAACQEAERTHTLSGSASLYL